MQFHLQTVPITINADEVALVGGTRVRLETIIAAFRRGESPEQIVDSFDVLTLGDVYLVIAYFLNNQEEVLSYLEKQKLSADETHKMIEAAQPDMFSLRNRLIAKKQQ